MVYLILHIFDTDSNGSFNLFYSRADKIITTTCADTTIGIRVIIPIYLFQDAYLNVETSNIFIIITTIATATREPIERTTIAGTAGATRNITTTTRVTIGGTISTSSTINTTTIATILIVIETIGDAEGTSTIITIITLIKIAIDTIRATATSEPIIRAIIGYRAGATSVINTITSDTGAGVSEFKFANQRRIRATPIRILNEHEHLLIKVELAE